MQSMTVDSPERIAALRSLIRGKFGLRMFYLKAYQQYSNCLSRCPKFGKIVEIGSGAGFVKELIPEIITSDILPYQGLDMVLDGTKMSFRTEEVKFFSMLNVLHHIPDAASFFSEVERCLCPEGRIFIVDQHVGWLSKFIFRNFHHEPFDPCATDWKFQSSGPLSGANGALAWIIFVRDREIFEAMFPTLEIVSYRQHSPLIYWMCGGLKHWSLVPKVLYPFASLVDKLFLRVFSNSASFVDIEILKKP